MRTLYFVGPWDLNRSLGCVPDRPEDGSVVLVESERHAAALPYHRQRRVLVRSAMRRFAEELAQAGYDVRVVPAPISSAVASGKTRVRSTTCSPGATRIRPGPGRLRNGYCATSSSGESSGKTGLRAISEE